MKTKTITLLLTGVLSLTACSRQASTVTEIEWDNSLTLPSVTGLSANIGVAGAFSGIINNRLIIAGGANFPDGYPWTGAEKTWHTHGYSYDPATGEWSIIADLLDSPLAYGVSIQMPQGILLIGGNNATEISRHVCLLTESGGTFDMDSITYPMLPLPLANTTGAMTDGKIFLAGGVTDIAGERSTDTFLMLDLNKLDEGWQQLPSWPGSPLGFCVSAGVNGRFYLFSGRYFAPDSDMIVHDEGYCYDPTTGSWTRLDNQFPVMAGTAVNHNGKILFIGGVEKLLPGSLEHPGFSNIVRSYDIESNKIDTISVSPYPLAVTTNTVAIGDTIYVASGEIKPGIRTPHILKGILTEVQP